MAATGSVLRVRAASVRGLYRGSTLRPSNSKHRVLLVEDDAAVRKAMRMLLEAEGFLVAAAASYDEAVRTAAGAAGIDILISDYHLGGAQTGIDVIRSVRERLGVEVKAILMTGDLSLETEELVVLPQLCVLGKPARPRDLLSLLSGLLGAGEGGPPRLG